MKAEKWKRMLDAVAKHAGLVPEYVETKTSLGGMRRSYYAVRLYAEDNSYRSFVGKEFKYVSVTFDGRTRDEAAVPELNYDGIQYMSGNSIDDACRKYLTRAAGGELSVDASISGSRRPVFSCPRFDGADDLELKLSAMGIEV